jgi:hypothetical protein
MSNTTIAEAAPAAKSRSRLRWMALALCAATMFVEGYDAQLMGYVVPGIARDWGVTPGSLTAAIAAGLVGMMGAFFPRRWPIPMAAAASCFIRSSLSPF